MLLATRGYGLTCPAVTRTAAGGGIALVDFTLGGTGDRSCREATEARSRGHDSEQISRHRTKGAEMRPIGSV